MSINLSHIRGHRSRSRSCSIEKQKILDTINQLKQTLPLFLTESNPEKQYYQRSWSRKQNVRHWGQRKLFITELYFLTNYSHLSKNIIYAGAAPGNHIYYLSKLFPDHHFYLIDPNPFFVNPSEKITILNQYFTDEICQQYATQLSDSLFISDIRTADYHLMSAEEHELTIQKDNELQQKWVQLLKPLKAMLKFRCPYTTDYDKKTINMLDGDIMVQPWAPHSSTETRLICDFESKIKEYNIEMYENQMFYHNDVIRIEKRFRHGVKGEGLENDFDSAADLVVLQGYLEKIGSQKGLNQFSQEVTKKLNCNRKLGTKNKPKEERRKFETRDHRVFYKEINKIE